MAAYGTTAGVSALLPAIGTLSGSSTPTSAQVTAWLDEGAAVINRTLAGAGYTVPVLSTATVYAELTALNNLYAAAHAMMARGLDTVQGTDENRSGAWLERFATQLDAIARTPLPDVPIGNPTTVGRRARFTQLRRTDGYSASYDGTEIDN